jgi:hypothetical protein
VPAPAAQGFPLHVSVAQIGLLQSRAFVQSKMQAEPLSQVVFGQVPCSWQKTPQCDPDAHVTFHPPQLAPS